MATLLLVLTSITLAQSVYYVKYDASGANDGSSWIDAYNCLQSALSSSSSGDDIWVAKGTYQPPNQLGGTGERFRAFQMKDNVRIYGGFEGNEDYSVFDLDDRDFEANETVLSGDLGGGVNVYHIFSHINLGLSDLAVLDGFTIKGGKADGSGDHGNGGGMLNQGSSSANGSSPTIKNCKFESNTANQGGAIYNSRYSNPSISNT